MACFIAPTVEAIVVTIVKKSVEKKEREAQRVALATGIPAAENQAESGISWSRKLSWLRNLLWGGVFLLAIEHIWHGEVVPWPPFLTAMNNPADIMPMVKEIATVGVSMALLVTAVWCVMCFVADRISKAKPAAVPAAQED